MCWLLVAGFPFDLIQAGISPKNIAGHKYMWIARFLEVVQQSLQAPLKCRGIEFFRRDVFSALHDDDVRLPIKLLVDLSRLIGGVLPLENIRDVDVEISALFRSGLKLCQVSGTRAAPSASDKHNKRERLIPVRSTSFVRR